MDSHEDPDAPRALAEVLWRLGQDIVVAAERDGRVRDVNPAARAWFARDDLRLLDVVHADHAPRLLATLAGETPPPSDFLFATPGGAGWRILAVTAAAMHDDVTVLVGRDCTVERRTQS